MIRPALDNFMLPQVQEITTRDRRVLSEHKPPGMAGSLLQNLGRRPMRIVLWGIAVGPNAQDFAGQLDARFRAAKPLTFSADIVADAKIAQVLIEDLRLKELAGKPQRVSYVLTLVEFIQPVDPAPAAGPDADIRADAQQRIGDLVNGIAAAQALATGLARFVPVFTNLLARLQAAAQP